jgi:hypothetical protein
VKFGGGMNYHFPFPFSAQPMSELCLISLRRDAETVETLANKQTCSYNRCQVSQFSLHFQPSWSETPQQHR